MKNAGLGAPQAIMDGLVFSAIRVLEWVQVTEVATVAVACSLN